MKELKEEKRSCLIFLMWLDKIFFLENALNACEKNVRKYNTMAGLYLMSPPNPT